MLGWRERKRECFAECRELSRRKPLTDDRGSCHTGRAGGPATSLASAWACPRRSASSARFRPGFGPAVQYRHPAFSRAEPCPPSDLPTERHLRVIAPRLVRAGSRSANASTSQTLFLGSGRTSRSARHYPVSRAMAGGGDRQRWRRGRRRLRAPDQRLARAAPRRRRHRCRPQKSPFPLSDQRFEASGRPWPQRLRVARSSSVVSGHQGRVPASRRRRPRAGCFRPSGARIVRAYAAHRSSRCATGEPSRCLAGWSTPNSPRKIRPCRASLISGALTRLSPSSPPPDRQSPMPGPWMSYGRPRPSRPGRIGRC